MNRVNDLCLVQAATGPKMDRRLPKSRRYDPVPADAGNIMRNLKTLAGPRYKDNTEYLKKLKNAYVFVKKKLELAQGGDLEEVSMKQSDSFFRTSEGFNVFKARELMHCYHKAYKAAHDLDKTALQEVAESKYKDILKIDGYPYDPNGDIRGYPYTNGLNPYGTLTHIIVRMSESNNEYAKAIECLQVMRENASETFSMEDDDMNVPYDYARNKELQQETNPQTFSSLFGEK